MKKNEVVITTIEDLTSQGEGVGKVAGFPLFIENALPGEVVEVNVLKVKKNFGYAKVMQRLKDSPYRVAVKDEIGMRIGTMPLQHLAYEQQLQFKRDQVKKALRTIAKMPNVEVRDTIGMQPPWHYRNKAQIPVRTVNGQLSTGFFRKNTHDLIEVEDFHIQDPAIDQAIVAVRDCLRVLNVSAYHEETHTGDIRHLVIRRSKLTGEMMLVLVTRTATLPQETAIIEQIRQAVPQITSIIQNVQPQRSNVIMGKELRVLYGVDCLVDQLLGLEFAISAKSFYQVNPQQTEILYKQAIEAAQLKGHEQVIDAYCGIGTISLALVRYAQRVYAMEIVPDAVEMAKQNAKRNQITNVQFEVGAAETVMPQWRAQGIQADVIVVDPPRKGLDAAFIEAAVAVAPQRIVYVSCNPATMARDIALFGEAGYKTDYVQPVDMFPQTHHVECVALLVKA